MGRAVTLLLLVILSDFGCHGNILRRAHNNVTKGDVPAYFALREVRWQLVAGAGGWVEAYIEVTQLGTKDLMISWIQTDIGEHRGDFAQLPTADIFHQKRLHQRGNRTYVRSRQKVFDLPPGRTCELNILIMQIVGNKVFAGPEINYQFSASVSSDFSSAPLRKLLEVAEPLSYPDPIYHYDNMEDVAPQFQSLVPSTETVTVVLYSEIESIQRGNPSGVERVWVTDEPFDDHNIKLTLDDIKTDDGQSIITTHLTLFRLESAVKYYIRVLMDEGTYFHQGFSILLVPQNQNSIYPHNAIEIASCRNPIVRDGILRVPAGYSNCIMCHAFIPHGLVQDLDVLPLISIIDYSAHDFVISLRDHVYFGYTFFNPTGAYAGDYTCSVEFIDGTKISDTVQLQIVGMEN